MKDLTKSEKVAFIKKVEKFKLNVRTANPLETLIEKYPYAKVNI